MNGRLSSKPFKGPFHLSTWEVGNFSLIFLIVSQLITTLLKVSFLSSTIPAPRTPQTMKLLQSQQHDFPFTQACYAFPNGGSTDRLSLSKKKKERKKTLFPSSPLASWFPSFIFSPCPLPMTTSSGSRCQSGKDMVYPWDAEREEMGGTGRVVHGLTGALCGHKTIVTKSSLGSERRVRGRRKRQTWALRAWPLRPGELSTEGSLSLGS